MATVVPERLLPGGSPRPQDEHDDEDGLERVSQAKQVSAANGRRNVLIPSAVSNAIAGISEAGESIFAASSHQHT